MLLQAQHFSLLVIILRVKHLGDGLRQLRFFRSACVLAPGEQAHIQLLRGARAPQAQRQGHVRIVTGDGNVVGYRDHCMVTGMADVQLAAGPVLLDLPAEVHLHLVVQVGHFPHVAVVQPVIRHLYLAAIHDLLAEQSVFIADAAAHGWKAQRGQ